MSFRPTISIYFKNQIVEVGYYRNWGGRSLLKAALKIVSLLHDCNDVAEIQRIYHENSSGKDDAGKFRQPSREKMEEFESYSEYAVVVDLTARCIYVNPDPPGCLSVSKLTAKPAADAHIHEMLSRPYLLEEIDFDDEPYFYFTGPIWFDQLDVDWVQRKLEEIEKKQAELWEERERARAALDDDDLNDEDDAV